MNTREHNLTKHWQSIDAAHHIHPFSDTAALNREGVRVSTRAEGVYLWDSEGHKIIDGMSGLWCVQIGYGNKEVADAGCEALHTLPYYNHFFKTTNPYTAELSAKLATLLPDGHDRVLFASSGSEANDTALKLIRYYWNLKKKPEKKIHLSRDTSAVAADASSDSALMIALDRGALEASYATGKYSDVLLTPDLRILISGPGQADLKIRVNDKGDTCLDNHGANAPYVTVASQFEDGVYRVQANQRVMFEHGSLQQVMDNEAEPCGCPAATPVSVANDGVTDKANPAKAGQAVGGPSSTPADTEFPLAVSEGLKPPPVPAASPAVPAGTVHTLVQAPIGYNSAETPNPSLPGAAGPEPAPAQTAQAVPATKPKPQGGFFHSVGHFFSRMFGRG